MFSKTCVNSRGLGSSWSPGMTFVVCALLLAFSIDLSADRRRSGRARRSPTAQGRPDVRSACQLR